MSNIEQKIEAILFYKGEPVSASFLARTLDVSESEVKEAVGDLQEALRGRGICILEKEGEYMLGTAPAYSELIEELTKEELSKDLGRAGLETLSIVLYLGPVTRSRVDYIRGVNSTFILRNLSVRGLVEKVQNPEDQRSFLYKPTFDLLSHLGVTRVEELPDYDTVRNDIAQFEREQSRKEEEGEYTEEQHNE